MHPLISRIRSNTPTAGYFTTAASTLHLERLAGTGYDYLVLDAQHGTYTAADLPDSVRAVEFGGVPAFIRVSGLSTGEIGHALDTGATGVIVPLVNDRDQAEFAVAAAKYPPLGIRSRGGGRQSETLVGSLEEVNAKTLVLCMIETRQGLENVEEIAGTPGLDGIYIGPNDLTIGLGGYGVGDPALADEFEAALIRILRASTDNGIAAVVHTATGDIARERRRMGFSHVTIATELAHMCQAAKDHLSAAEA